REEVWRRLLRDSAAQRDQADHFLALVRHLFPSREHIRAVLERRFRVAAEAAGLHASDPYVPFFEGIGAHMPSSTEFSSWADLIVVRSRERPRDAIQLVNALARSARTRRIDRIDERDFESQIREFSSQRVLLLAQEVESECPEITELVRLLALLEFDQGSFKISFERLRQALIAFPTQLGITLFGRSLRPDNDDDALALLSFFYELGVLNARISDSREKDGFRHVWPSADPKLVTRARWNELQAVVWEVHPAYRDHLIQVQKDKAAQTGLPPRKRRER
ncbi:MAG: P-loop ATPase, Sll1717 family, partial [bacterium]